MKHVSHKSEWQRLLEETRPRRRPEPRATISVRVPFDLCVQLDDRAYELGLQKREIVVAGIQMALESEQFRP